MHIGPAEFHAGLDCRRLRFLDVGRHDLPGQLQKVSPLVRHWLSDIGHY